MEDQQGKENMTLMEATLKDYVQPPCFEPLKLETHEFTQPELSIKEPPNLELNVLPFYLKYICLGYSCTFLDIIPTELTECQKGASD